MFKPDRRLGHGGPSSTRNVAGAHQHCAIKSQRLVRISNAQVELFPAITTKAWTGGVSDDKLRG